MTSAQAEQIEQKKSEVFIAFKKVAKNLRITKLYRLKKTVEKRTRILRKMVRKSLGNL